MFWGLYSIYLWMAEHAHVCNKDIEHGAIYITLHTYIHFVYILQMGTYVCKSNFTTLLVNPK